MFLSSPRYFLCNCRNKALTSCLIYPRTSDPKLNYILILIDSSSQQFYSERRVLSSERMKLVQFSVICLASAALSDFELQFAHPLSVIKRYKELQEITEMLHQCLELAENDFKIEKNCLETVFDNDYFWL